jgi:hypothetical protein
MRQIYGILPSFTTADWGLFKNDFLRIILTELWKGVDL